MRKLELQKVVVNPQAAIYLKTPRSNGIVTTLLVPLGIPVFLDYLQIKQLKAKGFLINE